MKFFCSVLLICAAVHSQERSISSDTNSNRKIFYGCVGKNVTLTWKDALKPGETARSSRWFFNHKRVVVQKGSIVLTSGSFIGRVKVYRDGSMLMTDLSKMDEGEYFVKIKGKTESGARFTRKTTLTLNVADELMTTDQQIHANQSQFLVVDKATNKKVFQLKCGLFTYTERPPFDVQWKTPSGDILRSNGYKDGNFFLLVPKSAVGGLYTCSLSRDTPYACSSQDRESSVEVMKSG